MSLPLNLTARAKRDVQVILRYIEKRSRRGADAWYSRFEQVIVAISESPLAFGLAPEDEDHEETIRQAIFKTRKGLPYRALFIVRENGVFVIHVRGPGQTNLDAGEVKLP